MDRLYESFLLWGVMKANNEVAGPVDLWCMNVHCRRHKTYKLDRVLCKQKYHVHSLWSSCS